MRYGPTRLSLAILLGIAFAAQGAEPRVSVRDYREANEAQILAEFTELLGIPNVASDLPNIRRNAATILTMMQRRGLAPRLLETGDAKVPPVVYGEWTAAGATRTLVFYAHYDGQPVDPTQWSSDPWTPTWRNGAPGPNSRVVEVKPGARVDPEWRLQARSAADDKAGVMAILAATDALKATGAERRTNLKFFFEGEEEAGSPHLREILTRHKDLLAADAWIVCDGPVHASGRKLVSYGARGDANVDITVYGAKRPLHSGHYGNWAPNPALRLAKLLASMKDDGGRVTIEGWYGDVEPLGEREQRALAEAPQADAALRAELGLAATDLPGSTLLETINLPSLNINGMRSADVGEQASNVIPTTAAATLDLRFVKGIEPGRQYARLLVHIRKQGFHVIDRAPTDEERLAHALIATVTLAPGGYAASRTPMELPISRSVSQAVQQAASEPIVELPSMGGSLPLDVINDVLGAPTITVPIVNHDNNQHAENENLRLQNLWDGIEILAAVMTLQETK